MLQLDPGARLSADGVCRHPALALFRAKDDAGCPGGEAGVLAGDESYDDLIVLIECETGKPSGAGVFL